MFTVVCAACVPSAGSAQSLSSALGATKLDGLTKFNDCNNNALGYREKLIADRMEAKLDATEVIDIATIPITALPSPFPKTQEEIAAERKAQQQARRQQQQTAMQGAQQNIMACQEKPKGLRLTMMADRMQKNLDAAKGLSAKDKTDYKADIRAVRDAAEQRLQMPKPVDPANPMRAMARLSVDDQIAMGTEFSEQYTRQLMARTQPH